MMTREAKNMSGSLMGAKRDHVAVGDRLNSVSPVYPDLSEFDRRAERDGAESEERNRTHRSMTTLLDRWFGAVHDVDRGA